jgi:hypothetical protein
MQAITPLNTPNNTKNFVPVGEGWVMKQIRIKPSVAIADGTAIGVEVVSSATTGYAIAMPATNANGQNFIGILAEAVTASDADYASTTKTRSVFIPVNKAIATAKATTSATATSAVVGRVVQFSGSGATVAPTTNGAGCVITDFVDANTVLVSFDVANAVTA